MLIAMALAGVLLAQAAAPAATPVAQPAAAAAKAEKPKKPKMICTEETPTDSFISKRVCKTAEQVEAERKAGRGALDDTTDHLAQCHGQPNC
jgi:hypothetical protein